MSNFSGTPFRESARGQKRETPEREIPFRESPCGQERETPECKTPNGKDAHEQECDTPGQHIRCTPY